MTITILTLFPEFFSAALDSSILKRAQDKNLVTFKIVDIREFAQDKHHVTDDRPFGGGPGMVMKVEPIALALESLGETKGHVVLTSAKGQPFVQQTAQRLSNQENLTIICGHYEGVDERVAENLVDEELRIGEYVLTGGEPAALVMVDAITRLIKGVLGNDESNQDESHSVPGQLGYPQYTRPEVYRDWKVPAILLGGNHKEIEAWRSQHRAQHQAESQTENQAKNSQE